MQYVSYIIKAKCPFKMFRNPKDEEEQLSSVADPQNKQRMAKNPAGRLDINLELIDVVFCFQSLLSSK